MSGDESGEYLKWLYERYGHAIYCHVRRLLRDADAAMDVTQDTFLAFMRSEDLPHEVASPRAWLFQTATNRALDWLRHRSRRSGDTLSSHLESASGSEGEHEHLVSHAGGLGRIDAQRDLNKLRQGERDPIFAAALLHFGASYTIEEVAHVLDISRRTASNYLRKFVERARKRSQRLDRDPETDPEDGSADDSAEGPEDAL